VSDAIHATAIPATVDARPASTASTRWLLDGPGQIAAGEHAGGVAGVVEADGGAAYIYPEITGYYLQWLAWRATRDGGDAAFARRAAAAQRWLVHWLALDPPPTRVHLRDAPADWRNDAIFFFDVAMALRGVASAAAAGLLVPEAVVVDGLAAMLARLVGSDGEYDACRSHRGAAPMPDRWSTRRGPFLAKAATGVVTAAAVLPGFPAELVQAAERSLSSCLRMLEATGHRETHPLLYAAEGFLALPGHAAVEAALPVIRMRFDTLLATARRHRRVPEFVAGPEAGSGAMRLDIVAQALRVGVLLGAHGAQSPMDGDEILRLRGDLTAANAVDGSIPFVVGETPHRSNVWATMFADQELAFAADADAALLLCRDAPLLV
jgi:hypothetical protein